MTGKKHFAIVDIETTGGMVKRDKMTEIAIVISDGERILDEYSSLINPGRSIPPFITGITGITDEMVADAPFFHEVAKDIVEWTAGQIFVAHNVRFDYGFLRSEFADLGFAFNRRRMCTVQMAKRLLQLPSHSLGNLIKHYGIQVSARHRALDDARATAIVLHHLLSLDGSIQNVQQQITQGVRESLLPVGITIDDLHELPQEAGLYYFEDESGDVIYIGKSKNIQKRVMSHFTKTTRKSELLQKRIKSISHQLTGTDLLAQIIEAQEIKEVLPDMNKAQRNAKFNHYIKSSLNALGYRRFDYTKRPSENDDILNAYSGPKAAKSVLKMLALEYGLCPLYMGLEIGMGPCSHHQFQTCYGACIHEESVESYNERAELAYHHIHNRFEKDFLIIDEGRQIGELSVVAVIEGNYYGHNFIDSSVAVHSKEEWLDHIPKGKYYPEINSMIRQSLKKNIGRVLPL